MLLSEKIKDYLDVDFEVDSEQEVEALALLAQTPGKPYASFLDDPKFVDSISDDVKMLIVDQETAKDINTKGKFGLCITDNPRLTYFKLHNAMKDDPDYARPTYKTIIGSSCEIHPSSVIAENNVTIGNDVIIEEHVSVRPNSVIGDGCILRAGSRVGVEGFEFKRENGRVFGVTHLGGVIMGSEVELQGDVVINKAVYPWDNTVLDDYVKIDDLVHVGHGVKLGKGVMVVALSGVGGRTIVGDETWIGFSSTVRNGITVGSNARVNMGAVVSRPVGDGESVTGNFAIAHEVFMQQLKKNAKGE